MHLRLICHLKCLLFGGSFPLMPICILHIGLLAALAQQPSDHWQRCTERPKYFWQAFNHDVF